MIRLLGVGGNPTRIYGRTVVGLGRNGGAANTEVDNEIPIFDMFNRLYTVLQV